MTGKPSKSTGETCGEEKKKKPRVKQRHRDTKNIGKRRKPSGTASEAKTEE